MTEARMRRVILLATGVLLVAELSIACGSMGLGRNRAQAFTNIGITLLLPMILLVPIEWSILKTFGRLDQKTTSAYLACLGAKPISILVVYFSASMKSLIGGVIAAEATYSLTHFIVSLVILRSFFRQDGQGYVLTAILISTVIPWSYSIGVPLAYFIVAHFNG
mgnify:CR=1 FL=1